VYRFASNGVTRNILWTIINTNRYAEKQWPANSCGRTIYQTMRRAGFENWTVGSHDQWHRENEENWNQNDLCVGTFVTPCQSYEKSHLAPSIPFADLALDVRKFPQGYDALDLTRMVKYALEKPQETWLYPRDYEKLLEALGGPLEVRPENTDPAVFSRWKDVVPPPAQPSPDPTVSLRTSVNLDIETHEVLKRRGKPKGEERRRRRRTEVPEEDEQELDADIDPSLAAEPVEQYVRKQPVFSPPPPQATSRPSEDDISAVFCAEGKRGQKDMFSAYAFGGPRTAPPYRQLHRIHPPEQEDISVWAENLRWVREQVQAFPAVTRWNESADHMDLITEHRIRQLWVSDEWLEYSIRADEWRQQQTITGDPGRMEKWRIELSPVNPDLSLSRAWFQHHGLPAPPPPEETFFGKEDVGKEKERPQTGEN
jgi:hypothetical protein